MIIHMANPVLAFGSSQDILEGFKRIPFIVVLDPWLSKTADLLADVVLPVSTMEKYEGPLKATDGYVDAVALRIPIMEPLGESRSELEIYLDLAERVGVLNAYLEALNKGLGLKPPNVLAPGRKPTPREVFELWAKSQGVGGGAGLLREDRSAGQGPARPGQDLRLRPEASLRGHPPPAIWRIPPADAAGGAAPRGGPGLLARLHPPARVAGAHHGALPS